jgi:hypothetical protein
VLSYIFNKAIFVIICVFLLCGCGNSEESYCQNVVPIEYSSRSIFANANQSVTVVPESGNMLALACHNCYQNNNASLTNTVGVIEFALEVGADLIELDISLANDKESVFTVSHEGESVGVEFEQLISQSSLVNSDQLLFIEIKNEFQTLEIIRDFLNILKSQIQPSGQYTYLNENRFVTIRHIDNNNSLARFRTVLSEQEFSGIKPFIKLSRLYYKKTEAQMYQEITTAHQCGFHMVELDVRLGVDVILSLNAYAETLGLAVNVFTLNQDNFEELVLGLKHDVDILTIEEGSWYELTNSSLIRYIRDILSE